MTIEYFLKRIYNTLAKRNVTNLLICHYKFKIIHWIFIGSNIDWYVSKLKALHIADMKISYWSIIHVSESRYIVWEDRSDYLSIWYMKNNKRMYLMCIGVQCIYDALLINWCGLIGCIIIMFLCIIFQFILCYRYFYENMFLLHHIHIRHI